MLKNAYLLAKIGADIAENELNLLKFCRSAVASGGSGAGELGLATSTRLAAPQRRELFSWFELTSKNPQRCDLDIAARTQLNNMLQAIGYSSDAVDSKVP